MWYKEGKGRDCICKFTVKAKPANLSKSRMREIETEAQRRGFQLAWAHGVSFILHGHRTLFQNLGGAAVKRVEVAVDEDEEVEFEAEGLTMAARLAPFGFKTTSIWYEAHIHTYVHTCPLIISSHHTLSSHTYMHTYPLITRTLSSSHPHITSSHRTHPLNPSSHHTPSQPPGTKPIWCLMTMNCLNIIGSRHTTGRMHVCCGVLKYLLSPKVQNSTPLILVPLP